MAKKFKNCRCGHCLEHFEVLTSDHVFPSSWYPKTTPEDIEKWQMPSCAKCNKKYGKIEEELMLKFGLCVDPFSYESIGLAEKSLRALNPLKGKNHRDKKIRKFKKDKILNEMVDSTSIPLSAIIPNFGFHENINPTEQKGVLVSEEDLKSIGEKLIRGITWVTDSQYIEKCYDISIYFLHQNEASPFAETLSKFGTTYSLGPGIIIDRAMAKEDNICGVYSMKLWGQFNIYATVYVKESKQ